jgi:ribokinase
MLNAAPVRWPAAGLLTFCDIVVVNESEAAGLTGASGEAAAAMLHAAGARRAVVTLGAAGCAVADDVGTITVAGVAAEAVDSTGAGDTLCGCLAARLAAGAPWSVALATAQRAAAITVTRPGAFAALPSASEMRGLIDAEPDAGRQAAPPAP